MQTVVSCLLEKLLPHMALPHVHILSQPLSFSFLTIFPKTHFSYNSVATAKRAKINMHFVNVRVTQHKLKPLAIKFNTV